jgi:hypothetical protein
MTVMCRDLVLKNIQKGVFKTIRLCSRKFCESNPILPLYIRNKFICKEKGNYITNDQIHICNTRTSSDYHQHGHKLNFIMVNQLLPALTPIYLHRKIRNNCLFNRNQKKIFQERVLFKSGVLE